MRKPPFGVLVVAREETVQGLLQDLLERAGCLVSLAKDEDEARAMISQDSSYDLVVADHPAPFLKGLRLVRWLKKTNPSMKMILIVFGEMDVTSTARAAGADEVLKWPLDLDFLRPMVREMSLAKSA